MCRNYCPDISEISVRIWPLRCPDVSGMGVRMQPKYALPSEKLPRYILPGVSKVKSINISSSLDGLIQDYSREFNVSQKDMFQIAMVEFFKKYGYQSEVKAVLNV
jgi:hypothetical protein